MRSAVIRKASQNELQNQATITTNNNYVHYFKSIKKLIIKVKIASYKTETKRNKLYFNRKDTGPIHNKARYQLNKSGQKTADLKNWLIVGVVV